MFNNNSAQTLSQKTQNIPFSNTQQANQTTQQPAPKPNIFQQNTLQTQQAQQTQQSQQPLQNNQNNHGQYQNSLHDQELCIALTKIQDFSRNEELNHFTTIIRLTLDQTYGIMIRAYKTGETITK